MRFATDWGLLPWSCSQGQGRLSSSAIPCKMRLVGIRRVECCSLSFQVTHLHSKTIFSNTNSKDTSSHHEVHRRPHLASESSSSSRNKPMVTVSTNSHHYRLPPPPKRIKTNHDAIQQQQRHNNVHKTRLLLRRRLRKNKHNNPLHQHQQRGQLRRKLQRQPSRHLWRR